MKVLYIHQYFRTPDEGGGVRSYYLTKELVKKGIDVEVISAHNKDYYETKNIDGVTVHFLPVLYDNAFSFKKRIIAFLRFALLACKKSRSVKRIDLCYVMTTPLTTGLIALWIKWTRNIPYIFEVGDLWPLIPVEVGAIKSTFLKSILFRFEKVCYSNASGVVALSPGIAEYIQAIVPKKPIKVIPNIADIDFFQPEEKQESLKQKYSINNKFVISYTGTFGIANHLEYLLEAAKASLLLPVKFLLVGEGAEKEKLLKLKKESNLENVDFQPHTDRKGIKEILNVSDAIYISFINIKSINTGSPNKLFDGLASGKLIITNFDGWIKKLIESNDAGFSYPTENTPLFTEKLLTFIDNKEILKSFQKNSRQLAENSFSLEMLSQRQFDFIRILINPIQNSLADT
ncbi:glycosyltransferase family 4 protein [Reichenbachiella sp. MALMAid0571]|uniref:glycosyltransferase family 4 protein n=1 Tax=Reichenbachiella sp. MALMAid0571 TaxID=3143939 RepID=UPI0032DF7873